MAATVTPLRQDQPDPRRALDALERHLDRSSLSANTARAYRRQARAYLDWLTQTTGHADAWTDHVGAEGAATGYRRHLLQSGASAATVNQAVAAVTLLYEVGVQLRIAVKRARLPRPGEPDALTPAQAGALQREADRRGRRDSALIALLLGTGARVSEAARLTRGDLAITARTGTVRLLGKGDEVRDVPVPAPARERLTALLRDLDLDPGAPLWHGKRGPLTTDGVAQAVQAVGKSAGIPRLGPHQLRHTYATRLRQGGADVAQVQALMGHASLETTARYFRAGTAETAAAVERVLGEDD